MTALKRFAKRLAATLRMRTNDDSRVRDELAEHLALLTEEYRRAGYSSEEAHERYGDATWRPRTLGLLLSAFAGLALVLALVGVFAVLAQSVAQRAREIAIRVALGASPRGIQRLVLARAMAIAAAGVVAGLGGAWFASRLLTTFLYEVEPTDPAVLSATTVLLFLVTLIASAIPAWRAAHIDPLETIRSE